MTPSKPQKPQVLRLKVPFAKFNLAVGAQVYRHPTGHCAPDRVAVSLEPKVDGCWFPVLASDVEEVA